MNLRKFLKDSAVDLGRRAGRSQELQNLRLQELDKERTEMATKGFVPDPEGSPTKLGSDFRRAFFYDPSMDQAPQYTTADWHESEVQRRTDESKENIEKIVQEGLNLRAKNQLEWEKEEVQIKNNHDHNMFSREYAKDKDILRMEQNFKDRFHALDEAMKRAELTKLNRANRWQIEIESLERLKNRQERDFLLKNPAYELAIDKEIKNAIIARDKAQAEYDASNKLKVDLEVRKGEVELKEFRDNIVHREYLRYIERYGAKTELEMKLNEKFQKEHQYIEVMDKDGTVQGWAINKNDPSKSHVMYTINDARDPIALKNAAAQMYINLRVAYSESGDNQLSGGMGDLESFVNPQQETDGEPTLQEIIDRQKLNQPFKSGTNPYLNNNSSGVAEPPPMNRSGNRFDINNIRPSLRQSTNRFDSTGFRGIPLTGTANETTQGNRR